MAQKNDDGTVNFAAYRAKRIEKGSLERGSAGQGQEKPVGPSWRNRAPTTLDVCVKFFEKIESKDQTIDDSFAQLLKFQGYERHTQSKERQLFILHDGDGVRYVMNRNFVTDEPSLCAITLDDFESEMLENRLLNTTYGSLAKARRGNYQPSGLSRLMNSSKTSEMIALGMTAIGAAITVLTYVVADLETAAFVGAAGMGLPATAYLVANKANKVNTPGILPYRVAKRQIIAADNPLKFLEAALGVERIDLGRKKRSS